MNSSSQHKQGGLGKTTPRHLQLKGLFLVVTLNRNILLSGQFTSSISMMTFLLLTGKTLLCNFCFNVHQDNIDGLLKNNIFLFDFIIVPKMLYSYVLLGESEHGSVIVFISKNIYNNNG